MIARRAPVVAVVLAALGLTAGPLCARAETPAGALAALLALTLADVKQHLDRLIDRRDVA